MNKRSIQFSGLVALTLVIVVSCTKDIGKAPVVTPPPVNICDSATYDKKIKTIIDKKCAYCHTSVGPSGGISLTSYGQVKSAADNGRIKARALDANPTIMPPASNDPTVALTQNEKDLIKCWLDKGSPQ